MSPSQQREEQRHREQQEDEPERQRAIELASRNGFASAVLVPVHSGASQTRISLLCLGSPTPGYFERGGNGNWGKVFKTTDRGAHWAPANSGISIATISTISSSPWNQSNVYVECYENGVFRSSDGGAAWTRCADFLSCGAICGIGLAPGVGADVMWALEGAG
jgi:photosystem II stability/assembly factor-like uncharacterized protein